MLCVGIECGNFVCIENFQMGMRVNMELYCSLEYSQYNSKRVNVYRWSVVREYEGNMNTGNITVNKYGIILHLKIQLMYLKFVNVCTI